MEDAIKLAGDRLATGGLGRVVDRCEELRALILVGLAQRLVERFDPLEVGALRGVVRGPELLGALKEHVLEIVGDPGRGLWVVLAPRLDHDRPEDPRGAVIGADEHGQAVAQTTLLDLDRIVLVGRPGAGLGDRSCARRCWSRRSRRSRRSRLSLDAPERERKRGEAREPCRPGKPSEPSGGDEAPLPRVSGGPAAV